MATQQLDLIRRAIQEAGRPAIEARFYLSAVTRRQAWTGQVDEGQPQVMVSTEFQPAKHGTFGKATPAGRLEMTVANSEAARLLDRLHLEALTEDGRLPSFRCWLVLEVPADAQ